MVSAGKLEYAIGSSSDREDRFGAGQERPPLPFPSVETPHDPISTMRAVVASRLLHKWLALLVGVQLAIWTCSGFYMVAVDLDFIHGDSLVRNLRVPLSSTLPSIPIATITARYPEATRISLRSLPDSPAPLYAIETKEHTVLLDGATGERLSPLPVHRIRSLARAYYAGRGALTAVHLIEHQPPLEVRERSLPLWRVDFDDSLKTTLYIRSDTGALSTRRHRFWRWFDFLWSLHIMDYRTREDMNNPLLRGVTLFAATTAVSGLWLLYFSFRHKLPFRRRRAPGV